MLDTRLDNAMVTIHKSSTGTVRRLFHQKSYGARTAPGRRFMSRTATSEKRRVFADVHNAFT